MVLTGLKVVIVEDEPLVALDLSMTFEAAGALPLWALSAKHALQMIAGGSVDACTFDLRAWNGVASHAVAQALREASVPYLVFDASIEKHLGAFAQLQKPTSADEVVRVVETYFAQRSN